MSTPECSYCGKPAKLVDSEVVYGGTSGMQGRSYGKMWLCRCLPLRAYVGCHHGTNVALGVLANAETRKMRKLAHGAFDPLWRNFGWTRKEAYARLAKALGLPHQECHIAMADGPLCDRIIRASMELRQ